MDYMFDLDLALTMPEDSTTESSKYNVQEAQSRVTAARLLMEEVPAAATGCGGGECTVCTECFGSGGAAMKVPCGHVFHESCILQWLSIHNSCPLCRRIIVA